MKEPPRRQTSQWRRRGGRHLSEEDVGRSEAGRDGGAAPLQGRADGPVHQLAVLGVVVLQDHGGHQLLGMLAQQQTRCHGGRTHRHLGEAVQKTHLEGEEEENIFFSDVDFWIKSTEFQLCNCSQRNSYRNMEILRSLRKKFSLNDIKMKPLRRFLSSSYKHEK